MYVSRCAGATLFYCWLLVKRIHEIMHIYNTSLACIWMNTIVHLATILVQLKIMTYSIELSHRQVQWYKLDDRI